ncbi:hypothetical protein BDZ91DRAFT_737878 [Kalaharituber pfeilii]|nr:hypothetical protein BDZ91DRAFT_737878 [Kalaharituber pfeilii]
MRKSTLLAIEDEVEGQLFLTMQKKRDCDKFRVLGVFLGWVSWLQYFSGVVLRNFAFFHM